MNGGKRPLGYTIIEVMIVLAVSGVMFIIAASFISGKQESTAFTEGANEFASQLQQTIAEVADGQYSDVTFGDMHIFEHWRLTNEPVMLVGMDALGLLDTMIIDYRRHELQIRMRDRADF